MCRILLYATGCTALEATERYQERPQEDVSFDPYWNSADGVYSADSIILAIRDHANDATVDSNGEHINDLLFWSRVLHVLVSSGNRYIAFTFT
jgi:hypothetical protein